MWWSTRSSPNSASSMRSAIAMPTAVAMPWPSGPVVVSTPAVMKFSGWPGVFESSWRKRLQLVDRHALDAGEVEQRVEQHRAVAGREHEAVAVGPARSRPASNFRKRREQHRRDVGHAHRQAGMARFRLLDRIHRERADRVRQIGMGGAVGGGEGLGHGQSFPRGGAASRAAAERRGSLPRGFGMSKPLCFVLSGAIAGPDRSCLVSSPRIREVDGA